MTTDWKPLWKQQDGRKGNYQEKVDRLKEAGWIYAGDRPKGKSWLSPHTKTFHAPEGALFQQKRIDQHEVKSVECERCSKPFLLKYDLQSGCCWYCMPKKKKEEMGNLVDAPMGNHIRLTLALSETLKDLSKTQKKSMVFLANELIKLGLEANQ